MIQFVPGYLFFGLFVLLGLVLVAWGWRLRGQHVSTEARTPECVPDATHEEDWVNLTMSSEDAAVETTLLMEDPAPRRRSGSRGHERVSRFLRELSARVLSFLNRMRGSETGATSSDVSADPIHGDCTGASNRPLDEGGRIARRGPALSLRAPRTFLTYTERHR